MICWLAVGRDPKLGVVAPCYEPPKKISPGVARYVLTGGSDGTTLAAVLAGLASKGVVAIQPQNGSYAVTLLNSSRTLLPDEAALVRALFRVTSTMQPYAESNLATGDELSPGGRTVNSSSFQPAVVTMRSDGALSEKMAGAASGAAVGLEFIARKPGGHRPVGWAGHQRPY